MKKVRVYNRSNSTVFYKDEETNKLRVWDPVFNGIESYKDLDIEEIQRALNDYGTKLLYEDYLVIKDKEICKELELDCPLEYFYGVDEIRKILENGSDFDLVDLIKNSNEGIKDMIKQIAVEIKLDSSRKRDIIKQHMNFDINFAIENEMNFTNKITPTSSNKKYITQQEQEQKISQEQNVQE